jgi:undecaprenyl-diphosphatase
VAVRISRFSLALPLAALVLSFAATATLLEEVSNHVGLAQLDRPTLTWMVAHRELVPTGLISVVSVVGDERVLSLVAAVSVLWLVWRRRRAEALIVGGPLAGAELVSVVLKHLVGRARPPARAVLGPVEHTLSFPSGHTIGIATFALALAYLCWRRRPTVRRAALGAGTALFAAAVMAFSRLYLADHWLTDVLASVTIASGVTAVTVLVDQWWHGRAGRSTTAGAGMAWARST